MHSYYQRNEGKNMLTIESLKAFGANTAEGVTRCVNNEAFYLRMVGMALNDANYGKLQSAVQAGDRQAAFEAAHALKGVLSNLALTPILKPVSEMTEQLRARNAQADYTGYLKSMWEARDRLEELIG